jgi:hypothetical protein
MASNGEEIIKLAREGKLNLDELQGMLNGTAAAGNNNVTIQDWDICYSDATGQLSEFCTIVANNPGDPVTGVGLLAYSANGTTLYALQYTNGFSSPIIMTSIGTTLYNPQDGNQALCVVYGWTESSSFYFTKTLTIGSC